MNRVLLSLLLAAHLLCMNVASAGPLIAVAMDWLGHRRRLGPLVRPGRVLNLAALGTLVAGSLLGLALGWCVWSPTYSAVIERLSYKIHFAVWELLFSLILLAVNVYLWRPSSSTSGRRRVARSTLSVLAATNLLYHFPPLLFVVSQMSQARDVAGIPITVSEFRQRMTEPHIMAQTLHFWLASVAVAGLVPVIDLLRQRSRAESAEPLLTVRSTSPASPPAQPECQLDELAPAAVLGGALSLGASVLQIPTGIWVMVSGPALISARYLGGDAAATTTIVTAILLAMALMHRLANIALADLSPRNGWMTCGLMATVVFLMSLALQLGRG